MVETAGGSFPLEKSHGGKAGRINILPNCSCVAGAIDASVKATDDVFGQPKSWRESQVELSRRRTIEVRLPNVHKAELQGFPPASLSGPLREEHPSGSSASFLLQTTHLVPMCFAEGSERACLRGTPLHTFALK